MKGRNEDVHELGREVGRDGTGDESLDLGLDRSLANFAEVRRTQVGGEEDDGVLKVDNSLRRIKDLVSRKSRAMKKSGTTHSFAVG